MLFKVPISWEMYGTAVVEADSFEEAVDKVINSEPLPEGDYVDASITLDHDVVEEFNRDSADDAKEEIRKYYDVRDTSGR